VSADDALDAELDRSLPSAEPLAYAVVLAGDQPGRVYTLHRNTSLIGRVETADVAISDASVSARHARIINATRGFEIEDLGSTNGTVIGGQRITRAPLRNGDRVTVGSVDFIFLLDRGMGSTVQIPNVRGQTALAPTGVIFQRPATSPLRSVPRISLPALPEQRGPRALPKARRDADDEPSLAELVERLLRGYRYVRVRWRSVATIMFICVILGLLSATIVPPRSEASYELKLMPQARVNPVEESGRPHDDLTGTFFQSPEHVFTSTELVTTTLTKLEGVAPDEGRALGIAKRLKLDAMGDHLYRASFSDSLLQRGRPPLAAFLTAHTQAYIQGEIDRALREFNAKVTFLRTQVKAADKELTRISDERTRFRAQNADRLPEDAQQTHTARFELESRRADLTAQVRLLEGQLEAARAQLQAGRPLAQTKFNSSESYRDSLADTNRKLSEAYARGLADGHPEVVQLKAEKERLESLIKSELRGESSPLETDTDPLYQAARSKVEGLQAQLSAARRDLSDTERSLSQVRNVVGDLPRVEAAVVKLTTDQESTSKLRGQLFERLKQAELQLNLEQVSVQSRYEIGRLTVARPAIVRTLVLRFVLGIMLGLFASAGWLGLVEARGYIAKVVAELDDPKRPLSRS
jgi:hypothetical protein